MIKDRFNKDVLKNATKAVAFILILFFMLRSLSYIMRVSGDAKDRLAGFYAEDENSIDVLMFGSSTVGTSFIPAYMWNQYGFTSYPISSNAQRPKAIKYLLEEALKYQNPKLVVVELRTFAIPDAEMALEEGHIREVVDNMKYSWHRVETINALTENYDDKLSFYFDIMKYHANIGTLTIPKEWMKYNYSYKDNLKGYMLLDALMAYRKKEENRAPGTYNTVKKAIPSDQEVVLRNLLEYLKSNDMNALFVVTPRDPDDDYEGNMSYMKEIIASYNYETVDVNEDFVEAGFDYRFEMNDGAHTNVWGALKVSDYIGKIISEKYVVNPEHSQRVTQDWNNAYIYFDELLNVTEPKEE